MQLPEQIKIVSKKGNTATFEISPLLPGYGATIANPLRRVLFSSLEGAAITSIKIKGVDHEFSNIPGVLEDVIEIILNLKKIRFRLYGDGPIKITLGVKGEKEVTAKDIKLSSDIEIINDDQYITTITEKKTDLSIEMEVEKGLGYIPAEQRQKEKLAIGVIAIDAIFSPVKTANFMIENVRVGQRTDYNKILMEIETDGSLSPESAMKKAAEILTDHFKLISSSIEETEPEKKTGKEKKKEKSAKGVTTSESGQDQETKKKKK